jgi:hypothetical protein
MIGWIDHPSLGAQGVVFMPLGSHGASLKDRLGDQRGGWMGADKNSSPKRELGLCPKFTTKDSHTSLPKSRSHNGPTNPRSKPQTTPKRKRNSKSKGLSSSALDHADRPQAPGGLSARPGRTVREHWVDCPRGLGGLSAWLRRTIRKLPPNLQYCTLNNGLSAMGPWTVCPVMDSLAL